MTGGLDDWFKSEVLVHEGMLMRFLARAWPRRQELSDLRQEAYARVYEAALVARPRMPKAFLFAIVRNIMSDRRRRERIVSIQTVGETDLSNDLIDEKTPERWVGARQEFARLASAFDRLPPRCREVVWMRRVQDLSQKEIAQRLGISEKTVENQISKGSRLLAEYMQQAEGPAHGGWGELPDTQARTSDEATDEDHG